MNQFTLPCLAQFILIGDRACEPETSTSGLYLSDLSGVNLELLNNLADGRYSGAQDYAAAILSRAGLYFQDQLKQVMASLGYQIPQGYGLANPAPNCSFLTTVNSGANGRGLICRRLQTLPKFSAFFVDTVQVKTATSGTGTLQIENAQGDILWSKSISFVAGRVATIPIYLELIEDEFYIVLTGAAPALDTYATVCSVPQKGCCGQSIDKVLYSITGWDGSATTANSFGLVLNGGVQCSFAQVACAILPYVAEAILNLCHAEILGDVLASPRINYSTLYADAEAITKQAETARARAKKSIAAQVGAMLSGLQKTAQLCISCNPQSSGYFVSRV